MTDMNANAGGQQPGSDGPQVVMHGQYLKDTSFENPGAPHALTQGNMAQPKMNVNVDVSHNHVEGDVWESVLTVRAEARSDDDAVFLAEVQYAGVFTLKGLNEEQRKPVLMIEGPRLVFPFVRAIISDMTREGGYPPLLLNPIDFADLYRRREAAKAGGGQESGMDQPAAGTA